MRLIDVQPVLDYSHNKNIRVCTVDLLEALPVVDAVPVVRGEWILVGTNEHHYETSVKEKCSLCGRCVYRYDTELQDNYCPNCGVKMDGEV